MPKIVENGPIEINDIYASSRHEYMSYANSIGGLLTSSAAATFAWLQGVNGSLDKLYKCDGFDNICLQTGRTYDYDEMMDYIHDAYVNENSDGTNTYFIEVTETNGVYKSTLNKGVITYDMIKNADPTQFYAIKRFNLMSQSPDYYILTPNYSESYVIKTIIKDKDGNYLTSPEGVCTPITDTESVIECKDKKLELTSTKTDVKATINDPKFSVVRDKNGQLTISLINAPEISTALTNANVKRAQAKEQTG